jgi:Lrp/AsnC family transcriptional regulator for asnA, asnC and gidA
MGKNRTMPNPSTVTLDEVNREIVRMLQEDGRRPYSQIARKVDRSEASVRQRVGKLVEAGVIHFVAITDQLQMGYSRAAMITITVSGDIDVVAEEVALIDEVDYLVATAGGIDLMAEVVAVDDAALYDVVGRIRSIAGVLQTETYVYFKIHKQTYQWGSR